MKPIKHIKTLIATIILAVIALGCTSREDNVNQLIEKYMFRTLFDFESYEPIETSQIDSLYTSIYSDSTALYHGYKIVGYSKLLEEENDNFKKYKTDFDYWSELTPTSYSIGKMETALKGMDRIGIEIDILTDAIKTHMDSIKIISDSIQRNFIGWKVVHRFRCKNKGGNFSIGNMTFAFDKDLKNTLWVEDQEDEDGKHIREVIEIAVKREKKLEDKKQGN